MLAMENGNDNNTVNSPFVQIPAYERPGRLDPDRNVPLDRTGRVDVNVHYEEEKRTLIKDSDSPEFTEQSANAMDPFEDTALLKGEIKPKVTGIRTGALKPESKIFVPEIDNEEVRQKVRQTVKEPEPAIYVNEEDKAASSDYIADAFSGVETVSSTPAQNTAQVTDIAKLRMYALLLGIVIVLEICGIGLMMFL